jgi:hypothetical protein
MLLHPRLLVEEIATALKRGRRRRRRRRGGIVDHPESRKISAKKNQQNQN